MLIRPAAPADSPALAALARRTYADAFGHSQSPSDLAAHLAGNLSDARVLAFLDEDTVLVAESDAGLVGYIQCGALRPDFFDVEIAPGDCELRRVFVLAAHQGRGIGAQLIDAALALPAMRAAPHVYLDVWDENRGAQKLYERYGFVAIGNRAFAVASGAETSFDVIMVRKRR